MKFLVPFFAATILLSTTHPATAGTLSEDCRAYANAIYAVAEARDNSDEPSWEKLLILHPILNEIKEKEGRGFFFAKWIHMRVINQDISPKALMTNTYEKCESSTGRCLLYNQGCGSKGEK